MGFLISINGSDFESYRSDRIPTKPLKVPPVYRSHPIESGAPTTFAKVLDSEARASARHLHGYAKSPSIQHNEIKKHANRVRDFMSSPVLTLPAHSTVDFAKEFLRAHKFHHVPVVDSDGTLLAMISDRDLLIHSNDTEISKVMQQRVIACQPVTLIREACHLMLTESIHSLPVLDELYQILGIITTTDILRSVVNGHQIDLRA